MISDLLSRLRARGQARGVSLLEIIAQDLRYGGRILRKSPGFTAVALLSLALGIGANTAAFSVIHAVLLRSLPYPDPNRLVVLLLQTGSKVYPALSIPHFEFWKEHSASFASIAGYRGGGERGLEGANGREWIETVSATGDFFKTLAVRPALGREFNPDELRQEGARAIMLTDGLWRRSFGADPAVLGRAVRIDDYLYTIVGVPANYRGSCGPARMPDSRKSYARPSPTSIQTSACFASDR